VKTVYNKDMDKEWSEQCLYSAKVTIEKNDGNKYNSYVAYPKGEPENDMTMDELIEKFRMLATRVLSENKVRKILETVNKLEEIKDIRKLTELLVP